jgi:hypothetical protein
MVGIEVMLCGGLDHAGVLVQQSADDLNERREIWHETAVLEHALRRPVCLDLRAHTKPDILGCRLRQVPKEEDAILLPVALLEKPIGVTLPQGLFRVHDPITHVVYPLDQLLPVNRDQPGDKNFRYDQAEQAVKLTADE